MKEIKDLLVKCDARLDNIDITMAKQSVILEEHVRRTGLLESDLKEHRQDVTKELAPVKKHVYFVNGFVKIGLGLLGLFATLIGLLQVLL